MSEMKACPACKAWSPAGATACEHCGFETEAKTSTGAPTASARPTDAAPEATHGVATAWVVVVAAFGACLFNPTRGPHSMFWLFAGIGSIAVQWLLIRGAILSALHARDRATRPAAVRRGP